MTAPAKTRLQEMDYRTEACELLSVGRTSLYAE